MAPSVSEIKPPSSNTGAPFTAPSQNQSLIDWFGFTMPLTDPWEVVDLLGLPRGLFSELERGGMGYKLKLQFNGIGIYYDGSENMGVHVEMSGKGCRDYEAHKQDWRQLIALIQLGKGHLTRLDIAIDTVDGTINLEQINQHLEKGETRTKFRVFGENKSFHFTQDKPAPKGRTFYFGSGTSRTLFRIYDKAAQMETTDGVPWVRFELQMRDERAQAAADLILNRDDLGKIATGIINENLSFIDRNDTNKTRCTLKPWWQLWLDTTERLKLTKVKAVKLLSEVQEYIKKQYAPTLAMLKKGLGIADFSDFLKECCEDGYRRMTRKHEEIILCSKLYTELPF